MGGRICTACGDGEGAKNGGPYLWRYKTGMGRPKVEILLKEIKRPLSLSSHLASFENHDDDVAAMDFLCSMDISLASDG